eukprot:Gb_12650 [translate_table: standard]
MTVGQTKTETYGRYYIAYEMYYQEGVNITNKGQEFDYAYIPSTFNVVDLSSNNLTGEIPVDVGKLGDLITLNLSNNRLSGRIPKSFGDIKALESLDFSDNQLSGEIPPEVQLLNFLGYLNLSYNNLSGRIPQQPHFDTFEASSFWGNVNLCGFQLNKTCPEQRDWPPIPSTGNDNDDYEEIPWWHNAELLGGIGVGFAVGCGGVFLVLWMRKAWRRSYFGWLDRIVVLIFGHKSKNQVIVPRSEESMFEEDIS